MHRVLFLRTPCAKASKPSEGCHDDQKTLSHHHVRGYAMTRSEITETTSTPYLGLEYGSTKSRQAWNGVVRPVPARGCLVDGRVQTISGTTPQ
ncbi:MAG: hypothetical protein HXY27_00880 [Hydrogenophilaceae bacterium]|nr:hypothetical protein [Hydrogenophilaceae bacterium]